MVNDKLLHVVHLLPDLKVGGMENGVVNLLNNFDRERFKLSLCCINDEGPLKKRIYRDDVEIINLTEGSGKRPFLVLKLYKIFKRLNVDLVHTHNFYTGVYGIPAARLARVPVIIHGEHGRLPDSNFRKRVMKTIYNRCDAILTVSHDLKEKLVSEIPSLKDKTYTIINGVDTKVFTKLEEKEDEEKKGHVIGTVGRLSIEKDYPTLIKAFEILSRERPEAKLVFVGKGDQETRLKELTEELDIRERVKFLGERHDVPKILNTFDIFVLCSLREGCSNVILEAFATGLPVVATRVGDNPLLLADNRGILVEKGSVKELAHSLLTLIQDDKRKKQIADNSFHWVTTKRSLKNMISDYENFYRKQYNRKKGKN